MIYWPGTNIVKSQGNVFTLWKTQKESEILKDKFLIRSESSKRNVASKPQPAYTVRFKQ